MKPSKRLGVLFLVALLGVLAMIGTVVQRIAGAAGAIGYAVLVVVLLAAGSVIGRRQQSAARAAAGHTCSCCSGTVHDAVKVL